MSDAEESGRWIRSTTRRAVLKLTGLVSLLGEGPAAVSAAGRDGDDGAAVAASERTMLADLEHQGALADEVVRYAGALAVDGDRALVGVPPSPGSDGPSVGRAVVFTRSASGWSRTATVESPGDRGQFGRAVALADHVAVVGAELESPPAGTHAGSAVVYASRDDTWEAVGTLSAPNQAGVDRFGTSVAATADTILVGASAAATPSGPYSGVVFAFEPARQGWAQAATFTPPTAAVEAFGRAVAIDDDIAVVGARRLTGARTGDRGVVYVYRRDRGRWRRDATLTPSRSNRTDRFGATVAIDDGTIVVSAPMESNRAGHDAGAVYVFTETSTGWRRQTTLHEGGGANQQFGTTLAVDGHGLLVGSKFGGGPVAFARSTDAWTRVRVLDADADAGSNRRGPVLALDGTRALIGGDRDPERSGDAAGTVEVFESR